MILAVEEATAVALASLGVAALAMFVGPLLAYLTQKHMTLRAHRHEAYAEMLYVLRLRQEDLFQRSMGGGTPAGEPDEAALKHTIAMLSLYTSPTPWKLVQSFMSDYATGSLSALKADVAKSQGDDAMAARMHLGELARTLDRSLDAITDAMRKDLGARPFYVKDRRT